MKFRFSCGMALLVFNGFRLGCGGSAEESIGQKAEAKQVLQRADQLTIQVRRRSIGMEVRPAGWEQRLTAVRQN
jgi:hypothetical protein